METPNSFWQKIKYSTSFWIIAIFSVLLLFAYFQSASVKKKAPHEAKPQIDNTTHNLVPTTTYSKGEKAQGQIIVKFKDGVPDDVITAHLKPLNASIKEKIPGINSTVI